MPFEDCPGSNCGSAASRNATASRRPAVLATRGQKPQLLFARSFGSLRITRVSRFCSLIHLRWPLAFAGAAGCGFLGGGGEVLYPVPAVLLRRIQAGVGVIQQCFHFVVSIASRDGDSHTHGDESLLAATNDRFTGDDFAQFIRAQQSVGQITVGQNQKKFLSAISANAV